MGGVQPTSPGEPVATGIGSSPSCSAIRLPPRRDLPARAHRAPFGPKGLPMSPARMISHHPREAQGSFLAQRTPASSFDALSADYKSASACRSGAADRLGHPGGRGRQRRPRLLPADNDKATLYVYRTSDKGQRASCQLTKMAAACLTVTRTWPSGFSSGLPSWRSGRAISVGSTGRIGSTTSTP